MPRVRLGLAGAALVAACCLPADASAHVPGIGNGLAPTTNGPDLRTATITGPGRSSVRFCFDEPITPTSATASAFRVRSYDVRRYWVGGGVQVDPSSTACMFVSFSGDVSQGTVAEVAGASAVKSASNSYGSAPASEPLNGSVVEPRLGATSGPDLIQVEQGDGSTLYFTFDEPVLVDPAKAGSFGVEDQAATKVVSPSSIAAVPNDLRIVKATFANTIPDSAIMALAREGAVTDRGHDRGGATPNPATELVVQGRSLANAGGGVVPKGAALYGAQSVQIQFSVVVSVVAGSVFTAYSETGEALTSQTYTPAVDGRSIYVDFGPRFARDPSAWVQVTVDPFSIKPLQGLPGAGNTLALARANQSPGYTSGPDLVGASIDADQSVTYRFDEDVHEAPAPAAGSTLFNLLPLAPFDSGQQVATSPPKRGVNRATIEAQQPTSAAQSVGAAVGGFDAASAPTPITDPLGYPAPTGSVSYQVEQAPSAPQIQAQPPAPQRVGVTSTLVRKKLKRTKKQRFVVKYSGRLSSNSVACIASRSIRFEARRKNGQIRTIGTALSNRRGAYALALRTRPKGKVFVIVDERPADNCGGATLGGINA